MIATRRDGRVPNDDVGVSDTDVRIIPVCVSGNAGSPALPNAVERRSVRSSGVEDPTEVSRWAALHSDTAVPIAESGAPCRRPSHGHGRGAERGMKHV